MAIDLNKKNVLLKLEFDQLINTCYLCQTFVAQICDKIHEIVLYLILFAFVFLNCSIDN